MGTAVVNGRAKGVVTATASSTVLNIIEPDDAVLNDRELEGMDDDELFARRNEVSVYARICSGCSAPYR